MEIDVYLPEFTLGFEYQDPHHYFNSSYGACTLDEYQARDREKVKIAKRKGITLIHVPFWWDWNLDSLIATIKKARPDLLRDVEVTADPFIADPPQHIIDKWDYEIPDLGIPMLALYLPKSGFDPAQWWIFEKYDGIRALWRGPTAIRTIEPSDANSRTDNIVYRTENGTRIGTTVSVQLVGPKIRTMYTRWGTPFSLPSFIEDSFPNSFWLDGEIWFGRERRTRREATRITSKANQNSISWNKFQYMIFDMPQPGIRHSPYHVRYKSLENCVQSDHPFVKLAGYNICNNKDSVETMFFNIRAKEGEGIILRDPNAPYIHGYSRSLYKYRGMEDAEALILEKISDKIFLCKINRRQLSFNAGKQFQEKEKEYENLEMGIDDIFESDTEELQIGKFVSFRYNTDVGGNPINPRIYAIRNDITNWPQLMHSKRNPPTHERIFTPQVPKHQWSTAQQIRENFNSFSKRRNFNPLVAANWKGLRAEVVKQFPAVSAYKFSEILAEAYPEVDFEGISLTSSISSKYWTEDKQRMRDAFDEIAKELSFDPLVAQNWHSLSWQDLSTFKSARSIEYSTKKSLVSILQEVYPDIGLQESDFATKSKGYFSTKENQRQFFENFATKNNFDPLQFSNWDRVRKVDLFQAPGGSSVWKQYLSLKKALVAVFPDMKGIPSSSFEREYLNGKEKKVIFETFANEHNLDPLIADTWYSIFNSRGWSKKFDERVIGRTKATAVAALQKAFPSINLQMSQFSK